MVFKVATAWSLIYPEDFVTKKSQYENGRYYFIISGVVNKKLFFSIITTHYFTINIPQLSLQSFRNGN